MISKSGSRTNSPKHQSSHSGLSVDDFMLPPLQFHLQCEGMSSALDAESSNCNECVLRSGHNQDKNVNKVGCVLGGICKISTRSTVVYEKMLCTPMEYK